MKKFLRVFLPLCLLFPMSVSAEPIISSPGAILMEASTGQILFEQDSHTALRPASVTKLMTLLLTYEAVRSGTVGLEDLVTVSAEAAGYGGSTILLEAGEQITLRNLIKGMCIASGNDAAVAAAEYVGGSLEAFVERMNRRAAELGMADSHFVNPCGLDADGHLMSAYDIALLSRELILNFPEVLEYTSTWHEMMPHNWRSGPGETDMTNTNKLILSYEGMTGLKTGYTRLAKYSLSATATREDLSLIAVVMGAETKELRSTEVTSLLDYGFGRYTLLRLETDSQEVAMLPAVGSLLSEVPILVQGDLELLTSRDTGWTAEDIRYELSLPDQLTAPLLSGSPVGEITYTADGEKLSTLPLVVGCDVPSLGFLQALWQMLRALV